MVTIAQKLRKNPSVAEVRFWTLIESLRLGGYHFRKQVPLGPFIVDFACHHAKLVVEIDGDSHYTDEGLDKDRKRDAALAEHGFTVLRFSNLDVLDNPDGVYETLMAVLGQRPPSLPSPRGGGLRRGLLL
ncbi:MAG: endonuclease protein [Devosia sp.]|nr:endonuclease protein [Devosia sp.]